MNMHDNEAKELIVKSFGTIIVSTLLILAFFLVAASIVGGYLQQADVIQPIGDIISLPTNLAGM